MIFGAIVGYIVLDQPPSVTTSPGHEIQYNRGASEDEARLVGTTLEKNGFLIAGHDVTVRVGHDHGEITVGFVVNDGVWDRPDTIEAFTAVRAMLAPEFPERVVVVQLCDDTFDCHRTIR